MIHTLPMFSAISLPFRTPNCKAFPNFTTFYDSILMKLSFLGAAKSHTNSTHVFKVLQMCRQKSDFQKGNVLFMNCVCIVNSSFNLEASNRKQ